MHPLRGLYLIVGVLIGVLMPFVPVILEQRGFSAPAIGVVTACTALGYVVALPVWGHLGDVVLGRRRALQAAALGSGAVALLFGAPVALPLVACAVIGYYVVESGAGMLTDALAVHALAATPDRYGRFRLIESGSFAVAALAAGFAYDVVGYGLSYLLAAASGVLVAIAVVAVPDAPRARLADYRQPADAALLRQGERDPAEGGTVGHGPPARTGVEPRPRAPDPGAPGRARRWSELAGSIGVAIEVEPRLVGVMAAVVLAHLGVLASFTFLPLRLVELGGPPSVIALSASVSAIFEIPAMLVAARFVSRVGLRGLFALACGLYALAFLSWVVLADPTLIVASRILTGLAYGALTVTIVLTVGALLPDQLQGSGQALYGMSAMGIASVIANLGGGVLFGAYGHGPVFLVSAVTSVAAAAVAWRYVPARGEVRVGTSRR